MEQFCVIGSGPSAISAAVALTRRGLHVTLLDAGHTLEQDRAQTVFALASQTPEQWNPHDVQRLKEGVEATSRGIPLKRLYGSEFPFATEGAAIRLEYTNAAARPSYARGGLSNVWGAGILPFDRNDMTDWPPEAADLEPHYRDVMSFVPGPRSMTPSKQGRAFLRDAARSKAVLAAAGIEVTQSSLAVDGARCVQCGLCLYGCPYGLIYNSDSTLRQLLELPNFHYEPGFVVERLTEQNGAVRIEGHDLATQSRRQAEAGRVLLGAGVLSSTAILLASLGEHSVPIRLQDSFYFLVPLLRFAGEPHLEDEKLHTLAQTFIAMRDPSVCPQFIHFSVYGYNDLMMPSLKASLGPFGALESLYSRTMVAGGYLHSSLSPGLWMTLESNKVRVEGEDSSNARALAKKAVSRLARQSFRLRAVPLAPAMRFFPPGRGFHSGGSFPMTNRPASHTSDIEGRPFGFEQVHLIDASCLPSIPATTITLPVMANAWRIANLAGDRA